MKGRHTDNLLPHLFRSKGGIDSCSKRGKTRIQYVSRYRKSIVSCEACGNETGHQGDQFNRVAGGTQIALASGSVDVVLLSDVSHDYYFSSLDERQELLAEIYRILKPHGLLSVYPKHMETEAKDEIESADFSLENEHSATLIHEGKNLERGQILNFKKKLRQRALTDPIRENA